MSDLVAELETIDLGDQRLNERARRVWFPKTRSSCNSLFSRH